jgi:DNA-binding NarL/FixJ family response regulator
MSAPLVVVVGSKRAHAAARRELEHAGHTVVDEWRQERGLVCSGRIANAADAAASLLCAVWGAGLVLDVEAPPDVVERLCEDLRRIGSVDYRSGERPADELTREERALLELLAAGATLGAAASALHLSRRTADRRLASARQKLGVQTTTEAVVKFAPSRADIQRKW